jgi:Fe-S cluster assembly protein SufD
MATELANESSYQTAFRQVQDESVAIVPWLKVLRENAYAAFEQTGFPGTDDEEWKYTNVAQVGKRHFVPSSVQGNDFELELRNVADDRFYQEAEQSRLVFINGAFSAKFSSTEALVGGVVAMRLADALRSEAYEPVVRAQLARSADYNENGFVALNTALVDDGVFIVIPKGAKVDVPIALIFVSTDAAPDMASFPRVLVTCERESSATLVESYIGLGAGSYLTNSVVEIVVEDNAQLEHIRVQRESERSFHIGTTAVKLGHHGRWNSTAINLGAGIARHGIRVSLEKEGAECWVDGLYVVGDGQHTDTHSTIDHLVPNCTSHQIYKGILDGKSRAVFNGKVFVHEGARGTDAMQTNRNLLLSNEARVDTKPQLEIFNDDVKCAHGATVGQLEEEELFYLVSRGLHTEIARNLLTYGFAEEVINKITLASIKDELDEAVLNRLHARLEA